MGFYQRKRSYKTDAFLLEFQKPFVVQANIGPKIASNPFNSPYIPPLEREPEGDENQPIIRGRGNNV